MPPSFEAESGGTLVPPMAVYGTYIASPTGNAGTALWRVVVPTTGTYWGWHRVECTTATTDSVFVSVDDGAEFIDDTCEQQWNPPGWKWTRVTNRSLGLGKPAQLSLTAGEHKYQIRERDPMTKIDSYWFTTDPNFDPNVPPTATPTPTFTPTRVPPTVCWTKTPEPGCVYVTATPTP